MKNNHILVIRNDEAVGIDGKLVQTTGEFTVLEHIEGDVLFKCKSLERGWHNNKPFFSCIPPAPNESKIYKWKVVSPSNNIPYNHIHILDVPDRTAIKVHRANYYEQLHGCIAVGKDLRYINKDDILDLTDSKVTMDALMASLTSEEGTIEIISAVNQKETKLKVDVSDCSVPKLHFPDLG
jgi:hypothetical protein